MPLRLDDIFGSADLPLCPGSPSPWEQHITRRGGLGSSLASQYSGIPLRRRWHGRATFAEGMSNATAFAGDAGTRKKKPPLKAFMGSYKGEPWDHDPDNPEDDPTKQNPMPWEVTMQPKKKDSLEAATEDAEKAADEKELNERLNSKPGGKKGADTDASKAEDGATEPEEAKTVSKDGDVPPAGSDGPEVVDDGSEAAAAGAAGAAAQPGAPGAAGAKPTGAAATQPPGAAPAVAHPPGAAGAQPAGAAGTQPPGATPAGAHPPGATATPAASLFATVVAPAAHAPAVVTAGMAAGGAPTDHAATPAAPGAAAAPSAAGAAAAPAAFVAAAPAAAKAAAAPAAAGAATAPAAGAAAKGAPTWCPGMPGKPGNPGPVDAPLPKDKAQALQVLKERMANAVAAEKAARGMDKAAVASEAKAEAMHEGTGLDMKSEAWEDAERAQLQARANQSKATAAQQKAIKDQLKIKAQMDKLKAPDALKINPIKMLSAEEERPPVQEPAVDLAASDRGRLVDAADDGKLLAALLAGRNAGVNLRLVPRQHPFEEPANVLARPGSDALEEGTAGQQTLEPRGQYLELKIPKELTSEVSQFEKQEAQMNQGSDDEPSQELSPDAVEQVQQQEQQAEQKQVQVEKDALPALAVVMPPPWPRQSNGTVAAGQRRNWRGGGYGRLLGGAFL
eukprot:gnl/TRDRNA2_/TRDRNA2_176176_c0_seq1.p1 gnl/TRDRNA2_/TRDRNA2_176176_c0~~gnl/TRDRNA2_/TRDRNA2_176176_c0_seq1.p1  ORF type:complete len:677 (+),score=193.34 gnl/TRDRNA2_/TRDRNA2_176176_c0_seq1:87-2117(+)